ncbi:MAG: NAD(P)-dependent oxidoreductase [Bacteroidales bacterium]|nr:NAD(P)-dependent oxidoreductase [Bacteroidales bacterium]
MREAKSVLITGASGFIGSHLVEEGLRRGYEVYAAIRKSSSRRYLTDSRIRFLEFDYHTPEALDRQLSSLREEGVRFDFIVHNAGVTKARSRNEFDLINHLYTRSLVESLERNGMVPDKFVFISSLAAIGPGNPETMQPVSDDTPPHPVESYGLSKRAAEVFLQSTADFPFLILRPTGVYGPRETDYQVVYRNLGKGFEFYAGSSGQRVSFLYIADLVRVIYQAIESDFSRKTWVVSDGSNYTVKEFSARVKQILGKKTIPVVVPLPVVHFLASILDAACRPFGKMPLLNRDKVAIMGSMNWQCDPSGIMNDLGFSPRYSLEEGLKETLSRN